MFDLPGKKNLLPMKKLPRYGKIKVNFIKLHKLSYVRSKLNFSGALLLNFSMSNGW